MDCESCGYSTCKNMVRAIYNNVNVKEFSSQTTFVQEMTGALRDDVKAL